MLMSTGIFHEYDRINSNSLCVTYDINFKVAPFKVDAAQAYYVPLESDTITFIKPQFYLWKILTPFRTSQFNFPYDALLK